MHSTCAAKNSSFTFLKTAYLSSLAEHLKKTNNFQNQSIFIESENNKEEILGIEVSAEAKNNIIEFLLSSPGQQMLSVIPEKYNNPEFSRRFSGVLFEGISYPWIRDQIKMDRNASVLSPEQTLNLWSTLYPNAPLVNHEGLNNSLRGISTPDGLVIKEDSDNLLLSGLIEYKCLGGKPNDRTQAQLVTQMSHFGRDAFARKIEVNYNSKKMGAAIHGLCPELTDKPLIVDPDFEVLYVVPNNTKLYLSSAYVKHSPVNSTQVYKLQESLIKELTGK